MSKISTYCFVVLLLLPSSWGKAQEEPLQDMQVISFDFGPKATVVCKKSSDNIASEIHVSKAKKEALLAIESQIRLGRYEIRFEKTWPSGLFGLVDAVSGGQTRCRVVKNRKKFVVLIGTVDRRYRLEILEKNALGPAPIEIGEHIESQVIQINKLIKDRAYDNTLRLLQKVIRQGTPELEHYAMLRMADVHVYSGRIPTAHAQYMVLYQTLGPKGLGMLARARAAEIAYIVDGKAPDPKIIDGAKEKRNLAFAQARRLIAELFLLSGNYHEALKLVLSGKTTEDLDLAKRIASVAIRRELWRNDSYQAAIAYLQAQIVLTKDKITDAITLFNAGQAFLDLDLSEDASRILQMALGASSSAVQRELILTKLLDAYVLAKNFYRAKQTADYLLSAFPDSPSAQHVHLQRARLQIEEGNFLGVEQDISSLDKKLTEPLMEMLRLKKGNISEQKGENWKELLGLVERQDQLDGKDKAQEHKTKKSIKKVKNKLQKNRAKKSRVSLGEKPQKNQSKKKGAPPK